MTTLADGSWVRGRYIYERYVWTINKTPSEILIRKKTTEIRAKPKYINGICVCVFMGKKHAVEKFMKACMSKSTPTNRMWREWKKYIKINRIREDLRYSQKQWYLVLVSFMQWVSCAFSWEIVQTAFITSLSNPTHN